MLKKSQVLKEGRRRGLEEALNIIGRMLNEAEGTLACSPSGCCSPAELARVLEDEIKRTPARSAWDKGVKEYALELLDGLKDSTAETVCDKNELERALLNGADSWSQFSYGGCSLIYDCDIAERVCSPSELKHCNGGEWQPNRRENWLDVQARALRQAAWQIKMAFQKYNR